MSPKLVGRGEGPKCFKESKCRSFHLCKETLGHFFQFPSFLFLWKQDTRKTLGSCWLLVGSYQCWAVFKCWPGSLPGSHNENILTLFNLRTGMKTDLRFSHDRELIYIYTRTGSLIELRSGSHSSLYHFIGFLLFFSLGTATLLLLLLLFFSHTTITFLTWCHYFRVMKSFNY
jgi:hypothetical protein